MPRSTPSALVRLYFFNRAIRKLWPRAVRRWPVCALIEASVDGLCLGLLQRDFLRQISEVHYQDARKYRAKEFDYQSFDYNRRGLWGWEQQAISRHFRSCRRLMVVGGGGGREVLALRRLGYEVDGFECDPGLVACANELLAAEGPVGTMRQCAPDECPHTEGPYDGIVIGWGAYLHIPGKRRRIAFLRGLRCLMNNDSPLLVSFCCRSSGERRVKVIASVANLIRWLLHREFVEPGDRLDPHFFHFFTREEIVAELEAAGFHLEEYEEYNEVGYAHAVARSRPG
jgi:hypothetical protein